MWGAELAKLYQSYVASTVSFLMCITYKLTLTTFTRMLVEVCVRDDFDSASASRIVLLDRQKQSALVDLTYSSSTVRASSVLRRDSSFQRCELTLPVSTAHLQKRMKNSALYYKVCT